MPNVPHVVSYPLEQLFRDQDRDWVADAIAPVLAWVPGAAKKKAEPPYRFPLEVTEARETRRIAVELSWDEAALEALEPGVIAHARRLRMGRSV